MAGVENMTDYPTILTDIRATYPDLASMPPDTLYGPGLRAVRMRLGLDQPTAALRIGLGSRQAVDNIERARVLGSPSTRTALTTWLRSVRAPLGNLPGISYLMEVGLALQEGREPAWPSVSGQ